MEDNEGDPDYAFQCLSKEATDNVSPPENFRLRIWEIICKLDETKQRLLDAYEEKRALDKEMQMIETAEELYEYYKDQQIDPKNDYEIGKDLQRTDPGNLDWEKRHLKTNTNWLYNVLKAYSIYDPEIGYAQGMGFIVSWVLKLSRQYRLDEEGEISIEGETNRYSLKYNESDTFFIWIHIIENLRYRKIFDKTLSKLNYNLKMVEQHLKCAFPEVYEKILYQLEIDLSPVFTSIIQTVFIYDLQSVSPLIAQHIFDVFLLDGESVIFTLITKFIAMKEKVIVEMDDFELLNYLKRELPNECLTEKTMQDLLDLSHTSLVSDSIKNPIY